MSAKISMMKSAALAVLTLSALSSCSPSPSGAAQARIDALQPYIGPCAGALAGDDIEEAREQCILLVVIADGA